MVLLGTVNFLILKQNKIPIMYKITLYKLFVYDYFFDIFLPRWNFVYFANAAAEPSPCPGCYW